MLHLARCVPLSDHLGFLHRYRYDTLGSPELCTLCTAHKSYEHTNAISDAHGYAIAKKPAAGSSSMLGRCAMESSRKAEELDGVRMKRNLGRDIASALKPVLVLGAERGNAFEDKHTVRACRSLPPTRGEGQTHRDGRH